MGLPILLLMLLQLPGGLETRVIEPREAPVSLVGLPCGDQAAKLFATHPTTPGEPAGPLQSEPFQCGISCLIGIRVNKGAAVDSVIVVSATAFDRGRIVAFPSPRFSPAAQPTCQGETVIDAMSAKVANWPMKAAFYFVSEVTFRDGTTWRLDHHALSIVPWPKLRRLGST